MEVAGFIAWLPRSPDPTQLDLFLLGYVKRVVCLEKTAGSFNCTIFHNKGTCSSV
jgi:hypothetical protein